MGEYYNIISLWGTGVASLINMVTVKWYSSLLETHLRATERRLPYGITQCYLPPDTGERAPPL